jgi:hypothetical protein
VRLSPPSFHVGWGQIGEGPSWGRAGVASLPWLVLTMLGVGGRWSQTLVWAGIGELWQLEEWSSGGGSLIWTAAMVSRLLCSQRRHGEAMQWWGVTGDLALDGLDLTSWRGACQRREEWVGLVGCRFPPPLPQGIGDLDGVGGIPIGSDGGSAPGGQF